MVLLGLMYRPFVIPAFYSYTATTYAGSILTPGGMKSDGTAFADDGFGNPATTAMTGAQGTLQLSGTWRAMGRNNNGAAIMNRLTLYVRIS
jgi:hypothetical protein